MTVSISIGFGRFNPVQDAPLGPSGTLFFVAIGDLVVDATMSETHRKEVELTSHPVEEGSVITDHARKKPDKVTIEGIITNTPVGSFPRPVFSRGISIQSSTDADVEPGEPGRAHEAYAYLKDLMDRRTPVAISTPFEEYESMILKSLSVTRKADVGDALAFTVEAEKVRVVTVKKTQAQKKLAKSVNKGPQKPKPVAPPKDQSILTRIADA